jgi:hypothetical protein
MPLLPFSDASPPTTNASLLTSGTLADTRLSSNIPLINAGNSFTVGQTISAAANTSALTASYSVTGANTTPLLNLSGTWNTSGIAKGLLLNITDAASAATSLLADFQNGGVSAFTINKYGTTSGTGGFSFTPASNTNTWSFVSGSTSSVQFRMASTVVAYFRGDSIGYVDINSTFPLSWNTDTKLYRDAANTLAQRNGTNAQTFRIYNTYTDASNYERGFMQWSGNVLQIGTESAGTGTARSLTVKGAVSTNIDCGNSGTTSLQTAGTTRVLIGASTAVCSVTWRIASGSNLRLEGSVTPASATATGTTGDIQWDANFLYVCTATNTWKRAVLLTW